MYSDEPLQANTRDVRREESSYIHSPTASEVLAHSTLQATWRTRQNYTDRQNTNQYTCLVHVCNMILTTVMFVNILIIVGLV